MNTREWSLWFGRIVNRDAKSSIAKLSRLRRLRESDFFEDKSIIDAKGR